MLDYKHYTKIIKGSNADECIRSFGHLIEIKDNKILVDGVETQYESLEEARNNIKVNHITNKLKEQATKELYEEMSDTLVASIIKEYHKVKITDTLVESYIELASSTIFSIDPVVHRIRSLNKLDRLVENKLHYVLKDNSTVAIDIRTQEQLNNLLQNHKDVVEYMRESKENFMYVLEKIGR